MRIGDKTFMNLQEAVGWLLENNALPFQSTANYVGNTEIALSTLVAPSPAKVRVGSLIFFADSKVSTVIGLTSNSFIVSDQYNDLVDDIVYVSNVAINASGHLIVTLSNGDNIDAGLIKQVTNFNINASQHLIANYNDGTSTDLGAIFSGNITIGGNLTVTGNATVSGGISGNAITGNSIIENMNGYTFTKPAVTNTVNTVIYAGCVKTGNKITFVIMGKINLTTASNQEMIIGYFDIPSAVSAKIIPTTIPGAGACLGTNEIAIYDSVNNNVKVNTYMSKGTDRIIFNLYRNADMIINTDYLYRFEATFLLSDSLAS